MTNNRVPPPPIRTDTSNTFAHHTMRVRLPAMIRQVQQRNPELADTIHDALDALHDALIHNAPIPLHSDPLWQKLTEQHQDQTWLATDWFFAETYVYRLLIDAIDHASTGFDPFFHEKIEELRGEQLWTALLSAYHAADADDALPALLLAALWGNRIDLSLSHIAELGVSAGASDLIVDDRLDVVAHLVNQPPGALHIICDNTGTELAMDLLLSDYLLDHVVETVTLHVKQHPTFVSDATHDDVLTLLTELSGRGDLTRGFAPPINEVGQRLQNALMEGRLNIQSDPFWNSGHFLEALPPHLHEQLSDARLVIIKGDANYRRMVSDALWAVTTPFADVTAYFPAPLLALRTIKSEPIVGLDADRAAALDQADADWRTSGTFGVIQFKP